MTRAAPTILLALLTAACVRGSVSRTSAAPSAIEVVAPVWRAPSGPAVPATGEDSPTPGTNPTALTDAEGRALEQRIADLKARGAPCATYAAVLERSYRAGQISLRPYMWRVGAQLASGEARPDGVIVLAREIDPLNVGRRTLEELMWTMEHEAAHIAFNLDSAFDRGPGDRADAVVRGCRG